MSQVQLNVIHELNYKIEKLKEANETLIEKVNQLNGIVRCERNERKEACKTANDKIEALSHLQKKYDKLYNQFTLQKPSINVEQITIMNVNIKKD